MGAGKAAGKSKLGRRAFLKSAGALAAGAAAMRQTPTRDCSLRPSQVDAIRDLAEEHSGPFGGCARPRDRRATAKGQRKMDAASIVGRACGTRSAELCRPAGFENTRLFTDDKKWFPLALFPPAGELTPPPVLLEGSARSA